MRWIYFVPVCLLAGCKVVTVDDAQASQPVRTVTKTVVVQAPASSGETMSQGGRAQKMTSETPPVVHSAMVGNWTTNGASPSQITVVFSSDGQFSMSARGNAARGTYTLSNGTANVTYEYTGQAPEGGVQQGSAVFRMTPDGTQVTVTSADPTVGSATLSKASL